MSARMEIYKCELCGIVLEVFDGGDGELVCCNEPMQLLEENTVDAAREKHVPVVEAADGGLKVTVGSVAHPMDDDHYIQWIEVASGDNVCRKHLNPGEAPEATFPCGDEGATVRELCNLHGLWKA